MSSGPVLRLPPAYEEAKERKAAAVAELRSAVTAVRGPHAPRRWARVPPGAVLRQQLQTAGAWCWRPSACSYADLRRALLATSCTTA